MSQASGGNGGNNSKEQQNNGKGGPGKTARIFVCKHCSRPQPAFANEFQLGIRVREAHLPELPDPSTPLGLSTLGTIMRIANHLADSDFEDTMDLSDYSSASDDENPYLVRQGTDDDEDDEEQENCQQYQGQQGQGHDAEYGNENQQGEQGQEEGGHGEDGEEEDGQ